jgi:hypothetical protein
VFKWHKHFAHLEDDEHTCQARKVRNEHKTQEIATLVCTSHSQMVDEVAAAATAARISYVTCHKILSDDLNMSHVTQHIVPRVLMQDLRDDHVNTCSDLIVSADKDWIFLNRIITREETWCFLYNLQLKQHWAT